MQLTHLSLENFRNYARLELELPAGVSVFLGENAQGKTNLLESVFYLATSRSFRANSDREVINWLALAESPAYCRLVGVGRSQERDLTSEVALRCGDGVEADSAGQCSKRIRVNRRACRALDLIGHLTVVMFTPQDTQLVSGAPALRRRFLDLALSQVDAAYVRRLSHYTRLLTQRNHLLRQLRDHRARLDQLAFWDDQLVEYGAAITATRQTAIQVLTPLAERQHSALAGRTERLRVTYQPSILRGKKQHQVSEPASTEALREAFRMRLADERPREIAQGMSVVGPHRDDLLLEVDDVSVTTYGSRGQQRTVSLALKLAESDFLAARTGEKPMLLLDDVLSELDEPRRRFVASVIGSDQQVLLTGTDSSVFPIQLLQANTFSVASGRVTASHPDDCATISSYPPPAAEMDR